MADKRRAMVSEITNFSTRDGPGIRTTVFLKGCPLRCRWCSNPETWTREELLYYIPLRCRGCRSCEAACPQHAISGRIASAYRINRLKCDRCWKCVDACLYNALTVSGKVYTVEEIMRLLIRDKVFFGSDGGVTFSGGEPLASAPFVQEVFRRCQENGIGTVLDTTGYCEENTLRQVLQYTDLVLLDLKHMDPEQHRKWTGVDNRQILRSARIIAETVPVRISLPLIGGVNDSRENLEATAAFARELGVKNIDINPLHTLGASKYHYLGKKSPYAQFTVPERPELDEVAEIFRAYGLEAAFGRMM